MACLCSAGPQLGLGVLPSAPCTQATRRPHQETEKTKGFHQVRKLASARREGSPHTERAVLSGAAQQGKQAGKASRLSDKSVKKKQEEKKGKTRSS